MSSTDYAFHTTFDEQTGTPGTPTHTISHRV